MLPGATDFILVAKSARFSHRSCGDCFPWRQKGSLELPFTQADAQWQELWTVLMYSVEALLISALKRSRFGSTRHFPKCTWLCSSLQETRLVSVERGGCETLLLEIERAIWGCIYRRLS